MNILVTGGAGYVGSHFAKLLARKGHRPVSVDNLSTGHAHAVRYGPFVKADLRDTPALIRALREHRIDAVAHFAAKSIVPESIRYPEEYRDNNVGGTRSLLDAMAEGGIKRLLFSSTAAVYGLAQTPLLGEAHPLRPVHPYGETKLECEQLVAGALAQGRLESAAVLRYFNVVGQDPDGELREEHEPETHLVPNLFRALRGGREFELFGVDHPTPDGTAIRDYVDVNDLVQVHLVALQRNAPGFFVSNVGTGRGYSVREVIALAEGLTGMTLRRVERERRAGDPPVLVADASHFQTWCNVAIRSLKESLRSMLA